MKWDLFRYIYTDSKSVVHCVSLWKLSLLWIYMMNDTFFLHYKSNLQLDQEPILFLRYTWRTLSFPHSFQHILAWYKSRSGRNRRINCSILRGAATNWSRCLQRGDIDKLVNPVNNYSGLGWGELCLSAPLHRHIIMCHIICNIWHLD